MLRTRRLQAAFLIAFLSWAVAAMAGESSVGEPGHRIAPPQRGPGFLMVHSGAPHDLGPQVTQDELRSLVDGHTAFALDLYRALRAEDGNLFFSPYSISTALAMTYAGARGSTADQMAATLHYDLPPDRLHAAINALDLELGLRTLYRGAGDAPQLVSANSLWGQWGFNFLDDFLDVISVHYGAGMRVVNFRFAPTQARQAINRWVEQQTHGRIVDLFPPAAINQDTRFAVANAMWFKASWLEPFVENATRDGEFHLLDGGSVFVPMMFAELGYPYASGDGYRAVELPYVGHLLSMAVIVPDEGRFTELESMLDGEWLRGVLDGLHTTRIRLYFPKFSFEREVDLKQQLSALGMPVAFAPSSADFSGIDGRRDLYLMAAVHKAFVAVDEKGTDAAAATGVSGGVTSVPPRVEVNRPFIFLIRDRPTGTVLFLGRVVDPT